jgi:hypothetical protein
MSNELLQAFILWLGAVFFFAGASLGLLRTMGYLP